MLHFKFESMRRMNVEFTVAVEKNPFSTREGHAKMQRNRTSKSV
jgi:hypothetical protein